MKLAGRLQLSKHPDRCSFRMPDGEVLNLFRTDVDFDPDEFEPEAAWGIEPEVSVLSGLGRVSCQAIDDTPEGMKIMIPTADESDGVVLRIVDLDSLIEQGS